MHIKSLENALKQPGNHAEHERKVQETRKNAGEAKSRGNQELVKIVNGKNVLEETLINRQRKL